MSSTDAAPRRRLRLAEVNPVYFVLAALIVAIVAFNPAFLEPPGYMNFLKRAAPLAILAAGQLFVIVSGGFDLSVGSIITFTVIGSSMLLGGDPGGTWWVIAAMYGFGLAVGLINGAVVCYLKVPSLIATLGMMITVAGAAVMWSGGAPRGYLTEGFRYFGRANIMGVPGIRILPIAVIVLVVVGLLLWWLMHRTNLGRMIHAVGDNPRAAQLAGVPVNRVRITAFVISALSAVTTGILLGGFAGVSTNVGVGFELAGDHRRGAGRRAAPRRPRLGAGDDRRGADADGHLHAPELPRPAAAGAPGGAGRDPHRRGGGRHLPA